MTKNSDRRRKSLAIVGAGSSGLVTLKMIRQKMPELEVFCFEKSFENGWSQICHVMIFNGFRFVDPRIESLVSECVYICMNMSL